MNDLLMPSIIAGLLSGLFWTLGDVLIVGFDEDLPRFRQVLGDCGIKDELLAAVMLDGSPTRLAAGAMVANFSSPLMVFSAVSLYLLTDGIFLAKLVVLALFVGFCLSPVAHVVFYHVGIVSKTLFVERSRGVESKNWLIVLKRFLRFLNINWTAAIGLMAVAWFFYSGLILFGHTDLPRIYALFTPLFGSPLFLFLNKRYKIGKPLLNGACFNVALSFFFLMVLFHQLIS